MIQHDVRAHLLITEDGAHGTVVVVLVQLVARPVDGQRQVVGSQPAINTQSIECDWKKHIQLSHLVQLTKMGSVR